MASTKGEWRVEQREKERASCRQTNTFPPCQQSLFSRNLLGPRHSYFLVLPSFSPLFYISKRVAYSGRLLAITNNGIDSLDDLRLHPLCALSLSLISTFLFTNFRFTEEPSCSIDSFLYSRVPTAPHESTALHYPIYKILLSFPLFRNNLYCSSSAVHGQTRSQHSFTEFVESERKLICGIVRSREFYCYFRLVC